MPLGLALKTKTCPACGQEIAMVQKEEDGNWIPVNVRRAATFQLVKGEFVNGQPTFLARKVEGSPYYVLHHLTCTDPKRFDRRRRG